MWKMCDCIIRFLKKRHLVFMMRNRGAFDKAFEVNIFSIRLSLINRNISSDSVDSY